MSLEQCQVAEAVALCALSNDKPSAAQSPSTLNARLEGGGKIIEIPVQHGGGSLGKHMNNQPIKLQLI